MCMIYHLYKTLTRHLLAHQRSSYPISGKVLCMAPFNEISNTWLSFQTLIFMFKSSSIPIISIQLVFLSEVYGQGHFLNQKTFLSILSLTQVTGLWCKKKCKVRELVVMLGSSVPICRLPFKIGFVDLMWEVVQTYSYVKCDFRFITPSALRISKLWVDPEF